MKRRTKKRPRVEASVREGEDDEGDDGHETNHIADLEQRSGHGHCHYTREGSTMRNAFFRRSLVSFLLDPFICLETLMVKTTREHRQRKTSSQNMP